MKTNRQARQLLGQDHWLSNHRKLVIHDNTATIVKHGSGRHRHLNQSE
ncbi:stationary-phase-induced ribosome-associated protein [Mangrovibacter phragmitis]|nr:stationary-phase-induced ribosome-associated protein [Mangrovibacter phragmitis]